MVLSVIKGQVMHLLCRVDYTRVLDLNNCYFDILFFFFFFQTIAFGIRKGKYRAISVDCL